MFCGECGTKNEAESGFCQNCGAKLNVVKKESPKKGRPKKEVIKEEDVAAPAATKEKENVKSSNPKTKKIVVTLIIILAVLGGTYYYLNEFVFTPKIAVEEFLDALTSGDTKELVKYFDVEESEFVSKEKIEDALKANDAYEELDYLVKDAKVDGDEAEVEVELEYDGEEEDFDFELESNSKQYLIFNNWTLTDKTIDEIFGDSLYEVIKDFEISVFTGSKVYIDGEELDDKYLSEDDSNDEMEVYVIPEILSASYDIKVILENGMEFSNEVFPTIYYSEYSLDYISVDDLSEDVIKDIEEDAISDFQKLYNYAIEGKTFDEIKDDYEVDSLDIDDLEDTYDDLLNAVVSYSSTLTKIDFTKGDLSYLSFEDGIMSISLDIEYDYELDYENFSGEVEKITNDSDSYISLNVKFIDGKYRVESAEYVISYFSVY